MDPRLEANWSYVEGSSRRHLRAVLEQAGPIDLFIHDSRHTEANVLFELKLAWAALRPGGVLLASGIIRDREDDVRAALGAAGLAVERREARDEWITLAARRT